MSYLSVQDLTKTFDDNVTAIGGATFDVAQGEFFTVVGPTNAGKSTLLKTIAGLERLNQGKVHLAGRDITRLESRLRHLSLLFQNIALFPTLTGFENIAFPLERAGATPEAIKARVTEVADLLRVPHVLDRYPRTFSGGEQQRVAIGRALAAPCDLLLLDEPLTNLDARIRIALRLAFKKLHRDTGQTIVYVTHDQTEAMSLSDRIGILNKGKFEQIGTPQQQYHHPASEFVARFIGTPPMNIIPADIVQDDGVTRARGQGFDVALDGEITGARLTNAAIGIHPETVRVAASESAQTPVPAEVLWIERLGGLNVMDIRMGGLTIKARTRPDHPVNSEGPAWLGLSPKSHHVLDRDTGKFRTAKSRT